MFELQIPIAEMNAFDLPKVCLLTGATEGVEFKKVTFAWYPRWIAIFALPALLLAAILAAILTKRAKGELPFTPQAYRRWKLGMAGFVLSFFVAIGLFITGSVFMGQNGEAVGGVLMLLAIAAPIAAWIMWVKGKNLTVKKIDEKMLFIKVPSQEAAAAVSRHLSGGAATAQLVA